MIQSMTGYASVDAANSTARWVWELRSVNGKALDLRFRLPPGFEPFEAGYKETVSSQIARGNVQLSLQLEQDASATIPVLNETAFDAAVTLVKQASQRSELPMPGLESVLSIKGVIEQAKQETSVEEWEALVADVAKSLKDAAKKLADARVSEGSAIAKVVSAQIDTIAEITQRVKDDPSRSTDAIRARLAANVEALTENTTQLDPDRLHQEAAILATKADLQEELDRLDAHVQAARDLLASGEAIGRRLDFLAQEFNRECNTICSKSNAPAVTAAGLEMKVVIDQFREQIQNLQ